MSRVKKHIKLPIFPNDIIVGIISRLPVKTLMRFQCVSKPWSGLISDPHFVTKHQNHTTNMNNVKLFVSNDCLLSMDYEALKGNDAYVPIRELAYPSVMTSGVFVTLLGSCNGLICLDIEDGDDYSAIILWNPSTGITNVLPEPPFNKRFFGLRSDKLFYGLGYDSSIQDYKVILGSRDTTETNPFQTAINVFTVRTNSWRTYQEQEINLLKAREVQACFLNGALHWIQLQMMGSTIISFDLADEKLTQKLPLPDSDNGEIFVGVGTTGNCLFTFTDPIDSTSFSIWTMKEYGVKESWTRVAKICSRELAKEVSVDHSELMVKPVCILESGEVLLNHAERVLVFYSPKEGIFKTISEADDDGDLIAVTYVETIVSPVTTCSANM